MAAESLAAAGEGARARLVAALAEECTAALSQLRGIVASFRMANRRAPTAPSPYAGRLLAPLAAFLAAHTGLLGADAAARLAREVAEGVAGAYASLAADTLAALEKTESSLRRLKSRQRMADGEGGRLSHAGVWGGLQESATFGVAVVGMEGRGEIPCPPRLANVHIRWLGRMQDWDVRFRLLCAQLRPCSQMGLRA